MLSVPGEYPQTHTTNLGHQLTVQPSRRDKDALSFSLAGDQVATLHQPDPSAPARADGLVEWRLALPAGREVRFLGPPGRWPINRALFHLGLTLGAVDDEQPSQSVA